MKSTTLFTHTLTLIGAVFLAACGSDEADDGNTGGSAGGGGAGAMGTGGGTGGGAPATCDVDFTDLASAPAVSFRNDVMPIFGLSCTASTQCHGSTAIRPKAGLFLGPTCQYDTTTMTCPYTMTPLTDEIVNMVHTNLLMASLTAPAVQRVVPGNPGSSFIIHKTADIHETQGFACTMQDSTATTPCGNEMPPSATLCLQNNGQVRFDRLAKWILDGAQNN